ncbi:MAG: SgcJ/EcaC family oxidoreductase [Planctomycetaceae bacterium]
MTISFVTSSSLHLASLLRTARLVAAGCAVVSGFFVSTAALAQPVAEAPTALDKAIVAEADATVKAFNGGDAAALARLFSPTGELVDENGNVFTGTQAITELFTRFFAKFPKAVLEMEVTATRPLGDEIAVEEGIRRITASEGTSAAQVRYVVVREKAGDRWPIVSYREFADDPAPTPREMLAALEWMVGEWVDESPEGRTSVSFRWSDDGNFLLGDYSVSVGGEVVASSTQRIGWDPIEGRLRSWTFDSDGGFTEGEWLAGDDEWIVRSEATMPDGTSGSATMTVKLQDADHFVVESTDRVVAGAEEPDFKLVVARKPPAPAAAK